MTSKNTTPRRVAIFDKKMTAESCAYAERIAEILSSADIEVVMHDIPDGTDLVISVGGDGTFLRSAAAVGDREIPILGVNAGRLGFLAAVTGDTLEAALNDVITHRYTLSPRSLIEVEVNGQNTFANPFALNEVAVLKHDNSSLIEVETLVDGHLLTNYLADGLIVSTPTGSTGYALSVGGPILAPDSPSFLVAPVAPHSLTMRPVVLSDESVLTLKVTCRSKHFLLSIDGRSESFEAGTTITLRKAQHRILAVKRADSDFFSTLRGKLMWGADSRIL